ncbi:MAG: T9SS type A sorting domain-containing protein [Bacteroidota bacterium]
MKKIVTLTAFYLCLISIVYSQTWSQLGLGLNDRGKVLLNDTVNNKLIVGGDFTSAGNQIANFIAAWDGTDWENIGVGFNAPVEALAMYNSELYAGGSFTMSGTDTVKYLAKWNGTNWISVGQDVANGNVKFLKSFQGKLYISGDFSSYGNITRKNIIWNGTVFDSIAGFLDGLPSWSGTAITDIAYYKFKTYYAFGGFLFSSNGFTYQGITGPSASFPIRVKKLEVDPNQNLLYVAGYNTDPNYYSYCANVYDGTNFQLNYMFNNEYATNGPINALKIVDNNMYMAGDFYEAAWGVNPSVDAYNITRYNPANHTFYAVNYGTDGTIFDIELYKNSLYATGDFVNAGNSTSNFISKLGCLIPPTVSLSSFSAVCVTDSALTLGGGSPSGGTYSGPSVNAGLFNPAAAGIGNHQITYMYTDSLTGCSKSVSKQISVSACGVGIKEQADNERAIMVFPNPSENNWNCMIKSNLPVYGMSLSDITGKVIWTYTIGNNSEKTVVIPNKDMVSGIYILKTVMDNTVYIQKLIKP